MDTVVHLIRTIDTTTRLKDSTGGRSASVYAKEWTGQWVLCRDTILALRIPLTADTTFGDHSIEYTFSDTSYIHLYSNGKDDCHKKWEIAADGGASFNSIPRFDNTTQHTRANGAQPVAALAFSRIFNHWFQAGVSAAYMTLSYQDDIAYPGSAPQYL